MSDSDFVCTESPEAYPTLCSQEIEVPKIFCGKLISTILYLPSIDLDTPEITVGRSKTCDVMLTGRNFVRKGIHTISKYHFKITCHAEKSIATITDLSRNGTFINSERIGKDTTVVLKHNDLISIGRPDYKVYTYKQTVSVVKSILPLELMKKYEFKKHLGKGACGEVILVLEVLSQKEYAIKKIIKGTSSNNLSNPLRIRNETNIMQSVSHPCVISVKEVVETDDSVFIVLEYMAGGELTDLVASSPTPLPESVVKLLFYQIVSGLRYLHLHNITHRDLKPGNILLQTKNLITVVKIADFGLSKVIDTYSALDTCCGTPCYIAPEIIDRRSGPYTQQVDVWSLGVILFYMLSSELPFTVESNKPSDIIKLVLFGTYKMTSAVWSSVSSSAKHLLKKMLKKNPDERFTIHEVANHPWLSKDTGMQQQVKELLYNSTRDSKKVPEECCDGFPPSKKLKLD